jgi:hypothetical protein
MNTRTRRRLGCWAARLAAVSLAAAVALGAAPAAAAADPTPGPGPGASSASPTATSGPGAGCVPGVPDGQVAWCFGWAVYTNSPPTAAPSHWLTSCSRAKTTSDYSACQTASLTLEGSPPDGSPSVLADSDVGNQHASTLVGCDLFAQRAQGGFNKAEWNAKNVRCNQLRDHFLAGLYNPGGSSGGSCDAVDVACQVGQGVKDAVSSGIRSGLQGLVDMTVQSLAYVLSMLAKVVFGATSIGAPDEAFFFAYNSAAGILMLLVFMFFIISIAVNGLRVNGPSPVATLGGLVRAVLGITFAGGIAWTIVAAWDEATNALIDHNATTSWDPAVWVKAISALSAGTATTFIAFCIAFWSVIGLVLLGIMMLFRGLLTTAAALFGVMAMTGQVMAETRHWGRRWFWTVNALASSKFFIVLLWIYGTRGAYGSDLVTSLKAMLIIWVMVLVPGVLLRVMSIWDGYLTDVNARGVVSAAAGAVGDAAGDATSVLGGQSGSGGAADVLNTNAAGIPTTPGGSAGGIGAGGRVGQAADAVGTGADGGKVGDVEQATGAAEDPTGAGGHDHDDGQGREADEAGGVAQGGDNARRDLAGGQLTPPGDPGDGVPATTPGAPAGGGQHAGGEGGTGSAGQPGGESGGPGGAGGGSGGASGGAGAGGAAADAAVVAL